MTAQLDLSALSSLAAKGGLKKEDTGDPDDDERWMKGLPKTSSFRSAAEGMQAPFGSSDPFNDGEAHTIA
ncbi:hypothetical protein [Fulvimarina manganoxydans]|uniref:hypothetical protein n=1 Tax=Fulvimarina manganoxydans TaxID=937218 RepID=UPI0009FFC43B|nr:hypothetical protein [Fulvimarina manganoxydans]